MCRPNKLYCTLLLRSHHSMSEIIRHDCTYLNSHVRLSVPWLPGVSIAHGYIRKCFASQCIDDCRSSTLWSTWYHPSDKCAETPRECRWLPTTPTEGTASLIDRWTSSRALFRRCLTNRNMWYLDFDHIILSQSETSHTFPTKTQRAIA